MKGHTLPRSKVPLGEKHDYWSDIGKEKGAIHPERQDKWVALPMDFRGSSPVCSSDHLEPYRISISQLPPEKEIRS
jgi:hypothetical protein